MKLKVYSYACEPHERHNFHGHSLPFLLIDSIEWFKEAISPRSDGSPVCRGQFGEVLIFYDRPSTRSSNAPACRGQSRLSGFCCAHRLCVRSPCQHISRMRTFDENSCAISITSPKVDFRPRNPTCLVGTRWQVPASVHMMWLPGKVPLGGTFPAKRGPVWTGGL